ncbi:MAG: RNA methyltransferase [Bacteroidetes bacterium]|nr:RNA methyltransferase [Bacteroidota bacterium]
MPEKISSLQNPRIKEIKKLLTKSSERKEQNRFVIEGAREIVLAHRAGYQLEAIFICEELLKIDPEYSIEDIFQKGGERKPIYLSTEVYHSLAYRETTEGIIAIAIPQTHHVKDMRLSAVPFILVIEAAEKPGNLGAMLRTADASGVDAVIICDSKTDLYNPNTIRSSIGTVFTNQIVICETKEAIDFLNTNGIQIFAAELNATKPHFQADFKKPTAIVVGSEAHGLSDEWIQTANHRIKIPMKGRVDSLNVSVSAAVLLYEALRQRAE